MQDLLTVKATAKLLAISQPYVYKLVDAGRLPCVIFQGISEGGRPKRVIRFESEKLIEFIKVKRVNY